MSKKQRITKIAFSASKQANNVINEQNDVELDKSKLSEHELEQRTNIQI